MKELPQLDNQQLLSLIRANQLLIEDVGEELQNIKKELTYMRDKLKDAMC